MVGMINQGRWFKTAKNVFLTGAGFTKKFGGYLASEMWALILNQAEVQQEEGLRRELLDEMDFEKVYDQVLTSGRFSDTQKPTFSLALSNAYKGMHEEICQTGTGRDPHAVGRNFVAEFQRRLPTGDKGFFFTLNQDLFVEKYYNCDSSNNGGIIRIPGLHHPEWFTWRLKKELPREEFVSLPDEGAIEEIQRQFWAKSTENFAYIKLHGSYGWIGTDGSERMVIGSAKMSIINQEPLLLWYLDLFREVLDEPGRNLVVVGYGFRDEHINEVIAKSIENRGLRLFVISPKQPRDFQDMLCLGTSSDPSAPHGKRIWAGLCGYYPGQVTDFYIDNQVGLLPQGRAFFDSLEY